MDAGTPDGLPYAEIPNDHVANTALQFRQTVDFLFANIREVPCTPPLLMLGAFGIELYLKSLNTRWVYSQDQMLAALGGYEVTAAPLKKGHSLVALLDNIHPLLQQELEVTYARRPVVRDKHTLRDALAVYDSHFVISRYPFEESGKGINGKSIDELVKLLDLIGDHVARLPRRVLRPMPTST